MRRLSLSRCELALFLAVTGVACFTGSAVGSRFFAVRNAFAEPTPPPRPPPPHAPLVVMVPPEGELFVGPSRNMLMTLHEEGNGGVLELRDPSGARIVVNDFDARIRGAEARIKLLEIAAQEKPAPSTPKIDKENPFDQR